MQLTNNQKKFLRTQGQHLKPVVMIGQHGLNESVLAELTNSLNTHELLKIKIRSNDKVEKQTIVEEIIAATKAHLVQVIGNVVVIYQPFDKDPQLILPKK